MPMIDVMMQAPPMANGYIIMLVAVSPVKKMPARTMVATIVTA